MRHIKAYQILNSRGVPTIEVEVLTKDGTYIRTSVPQGASAGIHEIAYLYDNDKAYQGKSVYKAVALINRDLQPFLNQHLGKTSIDKFDKLLKQETDAGNVRLVLSLTHAKLLAHKARQPLFKFIAAYTSNPEPSIPIPMFNVLNGGAHAANNIAIQEFMIVPHGIDFYPKQLEAATTIFKALKELLVKKGLCTGVGDEGGFAPNLRSDIEAIKLLLTAIEKAGYTPKEEISLALDIAISQYYDTKTQKYSFPHQGKDGKLVLHDPDEIIQYYKELIKTYPIISIEDGLAEDDWDNWPTLTATLMESNTLSVGDDITVTNPARLKKAISHNAISAIIIKPNQVGTLSETIEVIKTARSNGIINIASHRSGETNDPFIAHIAVGTCVNFLKAGAPNRGERINKYNELLRIHYLHGIN